MAFALLPALAGMGQQGQSQQDQALAQVNPAKNGQDQADASSGGGGSQGMSMGANPSATPGGGGNPAGALSALMKMGQQSGTGGQPAPAGQPPMQGQPGSMPSTQTVPGLQTQTSGTQPVSSMAAGVAGSPNGSDFGQFLMQLFAGQ